MVKKIQASVSQLYPLIPSRPVYDITSSIGLTLFGDEDSSIDGLLKKSDIALQNNEFTLHDLPQVNETGHLIGAEALLRWTPPNAKIISPFTFIAAAEESGLIVPIENFNAHALRSAACALSLGYFGI